MMGYVAVYIYTRYTREKEMGFGGVVSISNNPPFCYHFENV